MSETEAAGSSAAPAPARGRPRRDGRWLRRTTAGAVVLVLVAAGVCYWLDLGSRWFATGLPDPVTQPSLVLPPPGLDLPAARPVAQVAAPTRSRAASGAAVGRAVAGLVKERKLGRHVRVLVAQLPEGKVVYRHGTGLVTPASTMKLLTTVAALSALGPDHRFATSVVTARPAGGRPPRLVLVGGGDPLLTRAAPPSGTYPHRADLATLARQTATALRHDRDVPRRSGRPVVRLGYDTSLFGGSGADPHWEPGYLPDNVVSPISALWVDEGRERTGFAARSATPAAAAAEAFADALRAQRVRVRGPVAAIPAPRDGPRTTRLAQVRGAPLAQVVQHIVEVSDNEGAEVLAHQVAVATRRPGTFEGGATAVRAVLRGLGVDTTRDRIFDGSGLSRDDRLRPETLLGVLEVASSARQPGLRAAVTDLPVAGFTGSLARRFRTGDQQGPGRVRAKTGTLTGVHGLAGTVTTSDGVVLAFVAIADRVKPVNTLDARVGIDELSAALAGCRCAVRR